MSVTDKTIHNQDAAQQVFRQFAWNLAGTLAKTGGKSGTARRRVARRVNAKRGGK